MSRYAVVDVETTGLSPAYHHRIIEIAVVLVDDGGNVVYEWETLVNPERDVAATEIHGLNGADVYNAPTFGQIAGHLTNLLRGRVTVAHNLAFDAPFLSTEYTRHGFSVPLTGVDGLCTMRLASHYLGTGGRTLEACCGCIGYAIECAHSALPDAHATASLLAHYIRADGDFLSSWVEVIAASQNLPWPDVPVCEAPLLSRSRNAPERSEHFLGRLTSRTPRSTIHSEADSYFELLDRVLLDRQVSRHEEDELVAAADLMGICREDAVRLHRAYLEGLATVALEDGILTADELSDLKLVAVTLGLTNSDVESALQGADAGLPVAQNVGGFVLQVGDKVVFTGQEPGIDRAELVHEAQGLGLRVTGAVSGRTCLLVAADPDSISGKARKARELGIPIVDFQTFFKLMEPLRR